MTRRLDLAMGLVGKPKVVFLDEATTGLDPRSGQTMWQILRELAAGGITIFLTTQNLNEADQLADRIALLDNGKLIAEGSPAELKRLIPGGYVRLRFADVAGLDAAARILGDVPRDDDALTLRVPSDGSFTVVQRLIERFAGQPITVNDLSIHLPDLDDVFFALTGKPNTGKPNTDAGDQIPDRKVAAP